jgi:RsiW-degrading membrane proteinase PrsW (M82 family)
LAVAPALAWEAPFRELLQSSPPISVQFALSFLVVGLGEESCKLLAVCLAVWRAEEFSEPMDGILYAIAGGIGFSVVENILYISAFGLAAAPLRGTVAALAHIAFSGLAGYFLGQARFGTQPVLTTAKGLGTAAAAHGLYDFLLLSQVVPPWTVVLLVAGLQGLLFASIGRALQVPFRR